MGTLGYMAAEVCENKYVGGYSEKSDVFSLGVVLYEMLALNRHPFDAASWDGIIERIVDGRFPRLLARGYTDSLKNLVYLMLSRDVSHRPTTGQVLGMALVRDEAERLDRALPVGVSEKGFDQVWEGEFWDEAAEEKWIASRASLDVSNVKTTTNTDKFKLAGGNAIDDLLSLAASSDTSSSMKQMKQVPAAPLGRHKAASSINRASHMDQALPPTLSARDTGIFTPQFAMKRSNKPKVAVQPKPRAKSQPKAQAGRKAPSASVKVSKAAPAGKGVAGGMFYIGKTDF